MCPFVQRLEVPKRVTLLTVVKPHIFEPRQMGLALHARDATPGVWHMDTRCLNSYAPSQGNRSLSLHESGVFASALGRARLRGIRHVRGISRDPSGAFVGALTVGAAARHGCGQTHDDEEPKSLDYRKRRMRL